MPEYETVRLKLDDQGNMLLATLVQKTGCPAKEILTCALSLYTGFLIGVAEKEAMEENDDEKRN